MFSLLLSSCSKKADIYALYDNADDLVELKFKYAYSENPEYTKFEGHNFYYFVYSKIRKEAQLKSMGNDGNGIASSYTNVTINKFQNNENQLCLQGDGVRFIIENAGDAYILHMRAQNYPHDWEDAITFHNSDELKDNHSQNAARIEANDEEVYCSDDDQAGPDYNKIEYNIKKYIKTYSENVAELCYPTESKVINFFIVDVKQESDNQIIVSFNLSNFNALRSKNAIEGEYGFVVFYKGKVFDCSDLHTEGQIATFSCYPHENPWE